MTGLRIAQDLTLPPEAVTQTFGILAKRGAGKTHTASVMAEEMIRAGLPVVVVDPVGGWWGLRSSADGRGPGLPVVILGGDHGDVPLEPTGGEVVADLLADAPAPMVLDLSEMSKGEARRFMTDWLERLYHRNRRPLHVMLDEADEWAPQRPVKGAERLLGACEDMVRRGRGRGLGVTLISQRPAVIHKDVLTQIEVLAVLRITSPQDRAAIDDWIRYHDVPAQRRELLASLAKLPIGTAWWWSPGWLDLFQQVQVRRRETFDSSATPKVGAARVEPRRLADVDLEGLKQAMAATIERARANDPTLLQRRITQLERELAEARAARPEPVVERVEVPVIDEEALRRLEKVVATKAFAEVYERLSRVTELLGQRLDGLRHLQVVVHEIRSNLPAPAPSRAAPPVTEPPASRHTRPTAPPPASPAAARPRDEKLVKIAELRRQIDDVVAPRLGKAERAMLTVLAQHPAGRTRTQLALLSGYSIRSSSLGNALGALRSAGYVTPSGEPIQATPEGVEALGAVEPLPQGADLYRWWRSRLGKAERRVLDELAKAWPDPLDRQTLADRTGYSAVSSSLGNALGKLRSLELVDGWRASDDFMAAIGPTPGG